MIEIVFKLNKIARTTNYSITMDVKKQDKRITNQEIHGAFYFITEEPVFYKNTQLRMKSVNFPQLSNNNTMYIGGVIRPIGIHSRERTSDLAGTLELVAAYLRLLLAVHNNNYKYYIYNKDRY